MLSKIIIKIFCIINFQIKEEICGSIKHNQENDTVTTAVYFLKCVDFFFINYIFKRKLQWVTIKNYILINVVTS